MDTARKLAVLDAWVPALIFGGLFYLATLGLLFLCVPASHPLALEALPMFPFAVWLRFRNRGPIL